MCVTDPWAHMSLVHSILSLKLGVTTTRTARLAKEVKLQANRKDHHESSTLRHMVSSRSNDRGNILR